MEEGSRHSGRVGREACRCAHMDHLSSWAYCIPLLLLPQWVFNGGDFGAVKNSPCLPCVCFHSLCLQRNQLHQIEVVCFSR